jgi:putative transcriptional regulator
MDLLRSLREEAQTMGQTRKGAKAVPTRPGRPSKPVDKDISPQHNLANRLKTMREANGLTQENLAQSLGLSRQTIGNIENALRPIPSVGMARRWARLIKDDPEEIVALYHATLPTDHAAVSTIVQRLWLRRPRRNVVLAAIGVVVAVVVATVAGLVLSRSSSSAGPSCADVGARSHGRVDPVVGAAFRAAWRSAGGRTSIGCPLPIRHNDTSGFVHGWGPGVSQDLAGGALGPARLMQLTREAPVVVLSGPLNRDYTATYGQDTAPKIGYPASVPVVCGRGMVLPLRDGSLGTDGMALDVQRDHWILFPSAFWTRYIALGGPAGRLGPPQSVASTDARGDVNMRFEGGSLTQRPLRSSRVLTDREQHGLPEPPSRTSCP